MVSEARWLSLFQPAPTLRCVFATCPKIIAHGRIATLTAWQSRITNTRQRIPEIMTSENNNEDQHIEYLPNIKKYELSIVLLGQQSQLFWFSYGAFLVVEIGLLSIMLSSDNNSETFVVS